MSQKSLEQELRELAVDKIWSAYQGYFSNNPAKSLDLHFEKLDEIRNIYESIYERLGMGSKDYQVDSSDPEHAEKLHVYFVHHLLQGYKHRLEILQGKTIEMKDTNDHVRWKLRQAFHFGLVNKAMENFREVNIQQRNYTNKDLEDLSRFAYSLGYHNKPISAVSILHEFTPGLIDVNN